MWEGDANKVLDQTAMTQYKNRLHKLIPEKAQAKKANDSALLKELTDESEFITKTIAAATGLGRKDRGFTTNEKRAQSRVAKAIDRAINNIAKDHPKLGAHLNLTIKMGNSCTYNLDPTNPIDWDF